MDQRSDDIRNNIESTRASLDDKLDQLEHKAKETFDIKHQVDEHPFMMLGAAVVAGYVLGSLGGDRAPDYSSRSGYPRPNTLHNESHKQSGDGFMSQFDDEINMLKTAAIATVGGMFRDIVKEVVPAIGQKMDQMKQGQGRQQLSDGSWSQRQGSMDGGGQRSMQDDFSSNRVEPIRSSSTYHDPLSTDDHH